MALFRGIQEYIALDANNITLVFDSGNVLNISGNIFLYPPQGHPILFIIIHIELLVAKIKSCIPRALWGGQYFLNIYLILPGLYVTNHLTLIYVYDMS